MAAKKRVKRVDKYVALDGIDLETWRGDPALLKWSQTNRMFKLIVTLLVKERRRAMSDDPLLSENRKLGRWEGYEEALGVLNDMAKGVSKDPEVDDRIEYNSEDSLDDGLVD